MIRRLLVLLSAAAVAGCAHPGPIAGIETALKPPVGYASAQRYWDKVRAGDYSGGGSKVCTPAMKAALAADFAGSNRPEMMAFGDSLYNGVQSLRINWWLAEWSAPSLIAIRLGLIEERYGDRNGRRRFYAPQYPSSGANPAETIDYGFNLEGLPSGGFRLLKLAAMIGRQDKLLTHLADQYEPPNRRPFVDNISFSGANSTDLEGWTAGDFRNQARIARAQMKSGILPKFKKLGDAFTFSNATFVLNPMRNPCVEAMTPLDQIVFRQPRRLFINLGANNGIFRAAFSGASVTEPTCDANEPRSASGKVRCDGTIHHFLTQRLVADLRSMGERLIAEPGVEVVYVNGISRPSRPANVVVEKGDGGQIAYHTDLFTRKDIPNAQMTAADNAADDANAAIQRLLGELNEKARSAGAGPRFIYVDVDKAFERRDYKRCVAEQSAEACEPKRVFIEATRFNIPKSQSLDNRPMIAAGSDGLAYGKNFDPKIQQGGLFSFDNMHLSSIGYELMTEAVRLAIDPSDPGLKMPAVGCMPKNAPGADKVEIGSCRRLLVEPGYAYVDATRRVFIFQRIAGDQAMRNREFLKSLAAFAEAF